MRIKRPPVAEIRIDINNEEFAKLPKAKQVLLQQIVDTIKSVAAMGMDLFNFHSKLNKIKKEEETLQDYADKLYGKKK